MVTMWRNHVGRKEERKLTTETMRELGQAAEELLKERGPKYNMSNHEAEEKLRELQKEESMEKVYVC